MINQEKLENLKDDEIELLVEYLESCGGHFRNKCFEYCKTQNKSSKYLIARKNGWFWGNLSNFDRAPVSKIQEMLKDEYQNSKERVIELFNDCINHKFKNVIDNDFKLKQIIYNNEKQEIIDLLSDICNLDLSINFTDYLNEKAKVEQECKEHYEEELKKITNLNERIINDYNQQIEQYKNKIIEYEKQEKVLTAQNKRIKATILNKSISDEEIVEKLEKLLSSANNETKLNSLIREMLEDNLRLFDKGEDLSEQLIAEYVLLKMRGED